MSRLHAGIVLAVLAVAPTHAFAGACAMAQIPTAAITVAGAEVSKGGGVVVSMEDAAKAPKLEFVSGDKRVATTPRAIGAGLAVYEPPATGEWTLQDAQRKDMVKVKRATAEAKAVDAPKVASVKRGSATGRRGTSVWINVTIKGDAPAGALAVIVFDDKGAIRSWGPVLASPPDPKSKTSTFNVFRSGSCSVNPNGTADSNVGDKISVAWLDASGRLSAKSSTTIALEPPPPGTKTGGNPNPY